MSSNKYAVSIYDTKTKKWILKNAPRKEVEEQFGLRRDCIHKYLNNTNLYLGRYCVTGEKLHKPDIAEKTYINSRDIVFMRRYNSIMKNLKRDYPSSYLKRIVITKEAV